MSLQPHALVLNLWFSRSRDHVEQNPSLWAVILWAALGLVLSALLLKLDPAALAALQTLA